MVLILSEYKDISTNRVIDYLNKYDINFIRINHEDSTDIASLELNGSKVEFKLRVNENLMVSSSDITSIWVRRGIPLNHKNAYSKSQFGGEFNLAISNFMNSENHTAISFILDFLIATKTSIGNLNFYVNKIQQLYWASKVGIKTPETLITTDSISMLKFLDVKKSLVTKAIKDNFSKIVSEQFSMFSFAERITSENIESIPKQFGLSLFQNEIRKMFEIRSFYFDGKFYSMAQKVVDEVSGHLDIRKNYIKNSIRYLPFNLPDNLAIKLKEIFLHLGLNTGSVDLIYGEDGQFYYLEINPVGQFGLLSYYCNYNLAFEIFKKLTS